jgi:hypothetical protein
MAVDAALGVAGAGVGKVAAKVASKVAPKVAGAVKAAIARARSATRGNALPRARFLVTEKGVAIPQDPAELRANMAQLQEESTKPISSRKFVGRDSDGPIRVRIEKAHPADPSYTGPPDELHSVDHLHVDRRAKGETGAWGSNEKVPYAWPF